MTRDNSSAAVFGSKRFSFSIGFWGSHAGFCNSISQRKILSTMSATRSNKNETNFWRLGPKFAATATSAASSEMSRPDLFPILARILGRKARRDFSIPGMRVTSSDFDEGTCLGISWTAGFGRTARGELGGVYGGGGLSGIATLCWRISVIWNEKKFESLNSFSSRRVCPNICLGFQCYHIWQKFATCAIYSIANTSCDLQQPIVEFCLREK